MVKGFTESCFVRDSPDALVSFDSVRFIEFLVLVVVVGPITYRWVAWLYNWERDAKSWVDHFHDTAEGIGYSFVVFVLGNYAHTMSWWTVLGYFIGLFGWSLLGELSFMKVSLPTWRTWSMGAWIVHLLAVAIVVTLGVFHCLWAFQHQIFWPWYLWGLVVATSFIWVGASVSICERRYLIPRRVEKCNPIFRAQPIGLNSQPTVRSAVSVSSSSAWLPPHLLQDPVVAVPPPAAAPSVMDVTPPEWANNVAALQSELSLAEANQQLDPKLRNAPNVDPPDSEELSSDSSTASGSMARLRPVSSNGESQLTDHRPGGATSSLSSSAAPHRPRRQSPQTALARLWSAIDPLRNLTERRREDKARFSLEPSLRQTYCVHLHHWQIFYILAFFTRFPTTVSQICAGLVLGIFTHGGAAYGFDSLLEIDTVYDVSQMTEYAPDGSNITAVDYTYGDIQAA
ncbi:hypothetical protein H4R33_004186 [Dimargaris cristalligena]|uniref:Uncharacterized protein n=1 Tax=Dimargaris cristalligena TaxID=215637 RepID=A0A4P9ZXX2_9FUNG|nr:hypothetical protein H4R33_004186 [Dimargaris cristalligena]RKP38575.1 hypothetical protein BJ085DRAFT_30700 [Dimargaris cristalligena]|eukprot:RKP38575.1 hypothetical protein BJ085DRAFT_30700 [Dimargaris cristalligena]